ncbi:AraC family transcriptional regulator [Bradyrhizobium sp. UFLA05-109]
MAASSEDRRPVRSIFSVLTLRAAGCPLIRRLPSMIADIGEVFSAQKDGSPPTILASGCAPGESGVSVVSLRYKGGAHFSACLRQHLIAFVSRSRIACRLAGSALYHKAHDGSLAICPAGLDTCADTVQDLDALLVAVRPDKFALAAAEDGAVEAELSSRLCGHDQTLFDLAGVLARESKEGYPRGTLFWNEIAGQFVDILAARYAMRTRAKRNAPLTADMLKRLKEFVVEHLNEPLDVATLARMTHRSQFHFSRAFTRSVGVSPHRYVVHLRLQRAVEMIRDGTFGLAQIAAKTGFADQSHLTRWVRRVHGVSPTQIIARR